MDHFVDNIKRCRMSQLEMKTMQCGVRYWGQGSNHGVLEISMTTLLFFVGCSAFGNLTCSDKMYDMNIRHTCKLTSYIRRLNNESFFEIR